MTLKSLSALAIASIFLLSTVVAEAHIDGGRGGGPGRGDYGGPWGPGPNYPPPAPPRPPSYPPNYPPNSGKVVAHLPINQRLFNGTQIDLTRFIDVNYYRGMRVVSVKIKARSVFNNAILDLFVNGYASSSTYVSNFNQVYNLYPNGAIIGYNSLVLGNRGDVDVYGITVVMSR